MSENFVVPDRSQNKFNCIYCARCNKKLTKTDLEKEFCSRCFTKFSKTIQLDISTFRKLVGIDPQHFEFDFEDKK